jgi:hypothetical protein
LDVAENTEDRFDSEFASKLLLEIAQEQLLEGLLKKLVRRILDRPNVARVRIWLIEKGDICATCLRRPDCPDQTRCLHAVAGGGNMINSKGEEEEYVRMTDPFARIPGAVRAAGVGPQLQSGASGVCETRGSHRAVAGGLGKGLAGQSTTHHATEITVVGLPVAVDWHLTIELRRERPSGNEAHLYFDIPGARIFKRTADVSLLVLLSQATLYIDETRLKTA